MGLFDFLKSVSSTAINCPQKSIHIDSVKSIDTVDIVILAILNKKFPLYVNKYEDYIFEPEDSDGDRVFRGPVYKIEFSLLSGEYFEIFYGIVTDDRQGMVMSMTNQALDTFCIYVLKELVAKIPGIFDLRKFGSAPTSYTYYFVKNTKNTDYFYITNNSGSDSYYVKSDLSSFKKADRDVILSYIHK